MVDLCPICSYEHLLKSAGYLNEAKGTEADTPRYKDKIRDAVKELFLAQEHEPDPKFSAMVRKFRLESVEGPLFGGKIDTTEVLDDLQEMIDIAEKRLPQEGSVETAHKSYHKGKGHSEQYDSSPSSSVSTESCEQEVKECVEEKAGESEEECREMLECPAKAS